MIDLLGPHVRQLGGGSGIALIVLEGGRRKGVFRRRRPAQACTRPCSSITLRAQRDDIRGNEYAAGFFGREYRLDYRIHTYPKPVLCWGHGIVMGGGVGLMSGASHRVVTPESRVAMPEITIGLFPDVGGSWLLGRMPGAPDCSWR